MSKAALIICLILNFIIAGVTVLVVILDDAKGRREGRKPGALFRFFTTLSNVYAALGSLIALIYEIGMLAGNVAEIPAWAMGIIYSSSLTVAVTFVTVMVFLGPNAGYHDLVTGTGTHVHVVAPILAVAACIMESTITIPFWWIVWGVLPVVIYGILYLYMVVVRTEKNGGWEDFYGFNKGGAWKTSMAMMFAGGLVLSILLWAGCRFMG